MDASHADLLRDSVADFITRGTDVARARRLRDSVPGFERSIWKQMAELGWLGILVPEAHGGSGLGFAEMRIVVEGLSSVLTPEPVCAAAVFAGSVLRHSENTATTAPLLTRLSEGDLIPAVAWQESTGRIDAAAVATAAREFEGAYKVGGVKQFVHGAHGADAYIVSALGPAGFMLAWVPADAAGVSVESVPLADGRTMGTVKLADVIVAREHVIAEGPGAQRALERALEETVVMASCELHGVMRRALDMSLEYMRTRVQFGKPIGSFQALAHRAVDLHIQRELSSAVLDDAIALLDSDPDPRARAIIASRAKARCSEAGLRITREAIQLHGAIGFTDEYDIGLYLKRAMVLSAWLGNAHTHRRRYAALSEVGSRQSEVGSLQSSVGS